MANFQKTAYATAVPAHELQGHATEAVASVPSYMQSFSTEVSNVVVNEGRCREFLSGLNWPLGLQQTFIDNAEKVPIRYIICDDSGSMMENDGHYPHSPSGAMNCTRWEELTDALRFMLNAAVAANLRTEFRLLNACEPIRVGADLDPDSVGYRTLMQVFSESPRGGTPLCKHIRDVITSVREMETELRANRQRACIVICTDGVSSDGDLLTAMKPLERLPVWCVIKLCTDDDNIVNYWNDIDKMLEIEIDVLDDYSSEAHEVKAANPWLVYGLPLHRMREFGLPSKEFDILDSSLLTPAQMRTLVSAILGGRPDEYPEPTQNYNDFAGFVVHRQEQAHKQKDPCRYLREYSWIDMGILGKKYGNKSGCSIS